MKKISVYLFVLLGVAVFTFSSCKKGVLDKKPLNIISSDAVWKDSSLMSAYLTNCFSQTYVFVDVPDDNSYNHPYWSGSAGFGIMFIDILSDECTVGNPNPNWRNPVIPFKNGGIHSGGGILVWWNDGYQVIRKLNLFIQRVSASTLSKATKEKLVGQARWLRAYNYFAMVERYGGVPLVTKSQGINAPKDSLFPKRAKEQDIYDFIISECASISKTLPNTFGSFTRPNKYAALALKCRAALYAGSIARFGAVRLNGVVGIPSSDAQHYYQIAYNAADSIIISHQYKLYDKYPNDNVKNFKELFLDDNANPEIIFAVGHDGQAPRGNNIGRGWGYDYFQCPVPNAWGQGNMDAPYFETAEWFEHVNGSTGKLNEDYIESKLWTTKDLWANKDPRFYATIYTQNTSWQGGTLDFHKGIITLNKSIQTDGSYKGISADGNQYVNSTGFGVLKYLDSKHNNLDISNGFATSTTAWIVFRYGEVLLDYAEAAYNLGKDGDALNAVNQIRKRAGIALLTSIDRDKIRHERRVELAFEHQRYWDLRRWRIATAVLSQNRSGLRYILDYKTEKYKVKVIHNIDGTVTPPKFYKKNYYLPIPPATLSKNQNLVQNPEYNQ